jgi:hypothetical protein
MSYCPNCGEEVQPDWRYCTSCSTRLVDIATDERQTRSSPTPRDGFLSHSSVAYIEELVTESREFDPNSRAFNRLAREAAGGLQDFGMICAVEEINVLRLLGSGVPQMEDQEGELLVAGFSKLPVLYDRALGTNWHDELFEAIEEILEVAAEERDDIEWPPGESDDSSSG